MELFRDVELWSLYTEDHVDEGHGGDSDDHGEVRDEAADVGRKQVLIL